MAAVFAFFLPPNTGLTLNTIGSLRCIPCGVPPKSTTHPASRSALSGFVQIEQGCQIEEG